MIAHVRIVCCECQITDDVKIGLLYFAPICSEHLLPFRAQTAVLWGMICSIV